MNTDPSGREPFGPEPQEPEPLGHDGRPFPGEAEWLLLGADTAPPADGTPTPTSDFVRRTLQAIEEDRALDQALAREDEALPRELLQAYVAPAPGRRFTERTLQALDRDRRHRWQQLLARHVAPEPSPQFVARTLQALAADRDAEGRNGREPAAARPRPQRGAAATVAAGRPPSPPGRPAARSRRWIGAALIAAALGVVPWLSDRAGNEPRAHGTAGQFASADATFEVRLAAATSVASAAHAGTPLAAVLARAADNAEPLALGDESPDGLWLALGLPAGTPSRGPR